MGSIKGIAGPKQDEDLRRNPGIGQSKRTFATKVDPKEIEGENTFEGDIENDPDALGRERRSDRPEEPRRLLRPHSQEGFGKMDAITEVDCRRRPHPYASRSLTKVSLSRAVLPIFSGWPAP